MKKFLRHIVIFAGIIVCLLYALQYVVDQGMRKSQYLDMQMGEIFSGGIDADILVLGSSRAALQYSTFVLDSALHCNSFNAGLNGQHFRAARMLYNIYLRNNRKPRHIILNVDFHTLQRPHDLEAYRMFLPFMSDTTISRYGVKFKGRFTWPERNIPFYKYLNYPHEIKEGINCFFNTGFGYKGERHKGFVPNGSRWNGSFDKMRTKYPHGMFTPLDSAVADDLVDFIKYCNTNHINLFLVYAPEYYIAYEFERNARAYSDFYKGIAARHKVHYIDMHDDSLSYQPEYFLDPYHLNKWGAEKFTIKLLKQMAPYMQQ